jgi:hypothetical protein
MKLGKKPGDVQKIGENAKNMLRLGESAIEAFQRRKS